MGVNQAAGRQDAQGRSAQASDSETKTGVANAPGRYEPFVQNYETDKFTVDSDSLDEMLSIAIAVGNLL